MIYLFLTAYLFQYQNIVMFWVSILIPAFSVIIYFKDRRHSFPHSYQYLHECNFSPHVFQKYMYFFRCLFSISSLSSFMHFSVRYRISTQTSLSWSPCWLGWRCRGRRAVRLQRLVVVIRPCPPSPQPDPAHPGPSRSSHPSYARSAKTATPTVRSQVTTHSPLSSLGHIVRSSHL